MIGVYARVSTVGQNVAGQKREIQRWLDGNGVQPDEVNWFIDKASGDNLKRPGFEDLEAAVFAGEIKTVVLVFSTVMDTTILTATRKVNSLGC